MKQPTITIKDFVSKPATKFADDYYGYWDWFCRDKSLITQARSVKKKLKDLYDLGMLNPDHYVDFKHTFDDDNIVFIYADNDKCNQVGFIRLNYSDDYDLKYQNVVFVINDDPTGHDNTFWQIYGPWYQTIAKLKDGPGADWWMPRNFVPMLTRHFVNAKHVK